jgi:uncharacterized protein (DUF3820 family)
MSDSYKIKFGKHKGKKLVDIPFDYLRWLDKQDFCPPTVKKYVKQHKEFI